METIEGRAVGGVRAILGLVKDVQRVVGREDEVTSVHATDAERGETRDSIVGERRVHDQRGVVGDVEMAKGDRDGREIITRRRRHGDLRSVGGLGSVLGSMDSS